MKRILLFFLFALLISIAPVRSSPKRPGIYGIAYVRIFATNLVTSRKFYAPLLQNNEDFPVLTPDGWSDELAAWYKTGPKLCVEINQAPRPTPQNLLDEVVFVTDNIDGMRRYLASKGLSIQHSKKDSKYLQLIDPEGHRISFVAARSIEEPSRKEIERARKDQKSQHQQADYKMIHAGFVVHDRAAEDKFYKDVLGFHVYWHGGMKDGEDNWVDMQVPDGTDWIEYMLGVSPNASHKTLGVMNHIALGVPDIHIAEQQLIKNGFKPTEEPKIGRDGKWQLNLYDPDETRVELMEFKPTEKPCCSDYTGPHPHP
jgi:catechol 2,3-dioxygenase-like lactoylglutathione lyase family enzyme